MTYKFSYINQTERQVILGENADKFLIEEQNIKEGNFLIFSEVQPTISSETVTIPKTEYESLQQQLLTAQGVI